MTENWYKSFLSQRFIKYIDADVRAYNMYSMSILPDWMYDQAKELQRYYKATQVIK